MTTPPESAQQIAFDFQLDETTKGLSIQSPPVSETHLPQKTETLPQKTGTDTKVHPQTGGEEKKCREATNTYVQAHLNLRDWESTTANSQPLIVGLANAQAASQPANNNQAALDAELDAELDVECDVELLAHGSILFSPGGHFTYRVIGACCRLFDRNELPWPCCRIQWRGKEPSWRRIGKRFVPDLATKSFPSYAVEILDHDSSPEPVIVTLYWLPLSSHMRSWWYQRYVPPKADGHS